MLQNEAIWELDPLCLSKVMLLQVREKAVEAVFEGGNALMKLDAKQVSKLLTQLEEQEEDQSQSEEAP